MPQAIALIAVGALFADAIKGVISSVGTATNQAGDGSLKIGGTVLAVGAAYIAAKHFKVI